jgi:hypothetical protein
MNFTLAPALIIRMYASLLALLAVFAYSGCQTTPAKPPLLGWEDHRFSNHSRPYDSLLVEIDAVEGTQPSAHELAELESFLRRVTDKPGGIRIKVDNIIPREIARQRGPDALALEYLNGPEDGRAAFLYMFYYRSRLAGLFVKADNPQFTYFPHPCSVFIDRSFLPVLSLFYRKDLRRAIVLHEAAHALGLAKNPAHSKEGHCIDSRCLMSPSIVFNGRRFFTFRQPWLNTTFCSDCEQDLENYKRSEPRPNERLWNGYFVHEGNGYQFYTLPGFVYVHVGAATDFSAEALVAARRTAVAEGKSGINFSATTNTFNPSEHSAALALLAREKNEILRDLARSVFERCVVLSEEHIPTEPDTVRALLSDELIAAAEDFPEVQAKLKAVREKVTAPAAGGSG